MASSSYFRVNTSDESSMLCEYSGHLCGREKLNGHKFCLRHILEADRGLLHNNQLVGQNKHPSSAIVIAQQLFKQCNYTISHRQTVLGANGAPATITGHRRCTRPAPKSDRKDGFCVEHSRRALMARQKTGRKRSSDPLVNCLEDLSHYKELNRTNEGELISGVNKNMVAGASVGNPPSKLPKLEVNDTNLGISNTSSLIEDPLDIMMKRIPYINARAFDSSELEGDGDGGESGELITVESARWRPSDDASGNHGDPEANSDDEGLDSEMDNPLKYAGAYSAEEVIRLMREKLIRLQKLYIDQFQRLRYLLKDEARKFNIRLLLERDILDLGSIWMNSRLDDTVSIVSKETDKRDDRVSIENDAWYEKIKALSHYQNPKGLEAVLHHQQMERRIKLGESGSAMNIGNNSVVSGSTPSHISNHPSGVGTSSGSGTNMSGFGTAYKQTILPKCSYHLTSSTKCGDPVIPLSKFCIKHILEDTSQVLFRTCGYVPITNFTKDENTESKDPTQSSNTENFEESDEKCETPIADVFDGATCVYHTQFQPLFSVFEDKVQNESSIHIKKEIENE